MSKGELFTRPPTYANSICVMSYSTAQVANMIGVHKMTLIRWLLDGKIAEPRRLTNGGVNARVWNVRDVERARKYKLENYRKGRGRKAKSKR